MRNFQTQLTVHALEKGYSPYIHSVVSSSELQPRDTVNKIDQSTSLIIYNIFIQF